MRLKFLLVALATVIITTSFATNLLTGNILLANSTDEEECIKALKARNYTDSASEAICAHSQQQDKDYIGE